MARRLRDERGSGTALLGVACAVLLLLVWIGGIGGAYAVALHRTRGMADRAALAGALAVEAGRDPCHAARAQAAVEEPAGHVRQCRRAGDSYRYVVSVTVEYPVGRAVPGLPEDVRATAHAGPVDADASPWGLAR